MSFGTELSACHREYPNNAKKNIKINNFKLFLKMERKSKQSIKMSFTDRLSIHLSLDEKFQVEIDVYQ